MTAGEVSGTLNFSSAISYTVAAQSNTFTEGNGSTAISVSNVTLASASGGVGINVTAGTHTISSGVVIKNDATINVVANSGLLLSGTLLGTGHALTVTGGGSVQFGAIKAGVFTLGAGSAAITQKATANTASGTSVVSALAIGSGLKFDLTNNDLILDYANGSVADPAQTTAMCARIQSAYAGGAWTGNGLTSRAAAAVATNAADLFKTGLGYAEASAAGITTTFDGIAVDKDAVLVRYTFVGDANLDGKVNTSDFALLAAGFSQTSAGWVQGDFNYDGVVNALDFNIFATQFGATGTVPSMGLALGSVVPEPVSIAPSDWHLSRHNCAAGVTWPEVRCAKEAR